MGDGARMRGEGAGCSPAELRDEVGVAFDGGNDHVHAGAAAACGQMMTPCTVCVDAAF